MFIYLILIIIASFLQTTIISLDLVLMILLSIAFLRRDNLPLYLSIMAGLTVGLLSGTNLGFYSILYLVIIELVRFYRRAPLFSHILFIIPAAAVAFLLVQLVQLFYLHRSLEPITIIFDTLIFVAIYWTIQFFEDRLNTQPQLRLKLK